MNDYLAHLRAALDNLKKAHAGAVAAGDTRTAEQVNVMIHRCEGLLAMPRGVV